MVASPPGVSFEDRFWPSVGQLAPVENGRVVDALNHFRRDPNHPGLNLEPIEGRTDGLMSIRASRDIRIILHRRGNTYVWLYAEHHDAAYERARRGQFVVNPHTQFMGFVERSSVGEPRLATTTEHRGASISRAPGAPRPFDHWTDRELQSAGMSDDEIIDLRGADDDEALIDLTERGWTDDRVVAVIDLVELTPEQWLAQADAAPASIEAEAEERLRASIHRFGALTGLSPLFSEDELEKIASAPIEDWMLFLHPDQRSLVDRTFSGPARVRGAAGTGKTVVALHRAATLAKRYRDEADNRILVTTYINSLPPVFDRLFHRLPEARDGQVEFVNVDKLAFQICTDAGWKPFVDGRAVDAAFAAAWKKVVTAGSPIDRAGLTRGYVTDEIRAVIKGRGLITIDEYLPLKRTGRRTQFGEPLRRQVWDLKGEWDDGIQRRGVEDFHDIVIRARDLARARPQPTYRAAIIDEAQDLTLVALQMVRALVNGPGDDRPDGLFIAGDGAQRIYAGGFTLRQAEIEVRGRTSVLRVNYRNTEQIYRAAIAVTGADDVEDLEEDYRRADEPAELGRSGAPVELLIGSSFDDELSQMARRIRELAGAGDAVSLGDIAVCCATRAQNEAAGKLLASVGVKTQDLAMYDGRPNNLVKLGTHHRAKGLEFKVVFLPGLTRGNFPPPPAPGMDPKEYSDHRALRMSALFVAMTRARDRLIVSCTDEPSEVLGPVLDRLSRSGATS